MNKASFCIWGREFTLDLYYEGSRKAEPSQNQKKAFSAFQSATMEIEKSCQDVKEYVLHDSPQQFEEKTIENIFRYVMPAYIYIPQSRDDEHETAIIMCDYKFDPEHGLAVVFENGRFVQVCPQDDVL